MSRADEATQGQGVLTHSAGSQIWETAVLQDEIRRRERDLVTLKLQLNAVAFIMKLPDELLLEVFYYYLGWWKATFGSSGFFLGYSTKFKGHHGWVLVTHVCHRWRTLAVSAPLLWTDIKINRQSLVYAFLARSQQAPLSIQCRVAAKDALKDSRKFQAIKAALAQSRRIRSLLFQYTGIDPETGDAVGASPELGRCEFPELQELILWLDGGYDTTLPSFVARGSFPKLRSLETRMYNLSNLASVIASPHLTRLKLCAFNGNNSVTWPALFNFFSALPQLEVLNLIAGLPRVRTMLNQQIAELPLFDRMLTMPKLQMLSLNCQGLSCATLLRHMSFPVTAKVKIDLSSPLEVFEAEGGNDFHLIAPVIGECMSGTRLMGTVEPILSLSVDTMMGYDMRINTWRTALSIDSPASDSVDPSYRAIHDDACFQLIFRAYSGGTILTRVCRALPLANVQRLFVGELHPNGLPLVPTRRQWIDLFGLLTKVSHLCVYEKSALHVVAAMTPIVSVRPGETRLGAQVLFPNIEMLKLQYVTLTGAHLRDWASQLRGGGWRIKVQPMGQDARFAIVPTKLTKIIIRKAVRVDAQHVTGFKNSLSNHARIEVEWDGVTSWKGATPSRKRFARLEPEYWVDDEET